MSLKDRARIHNALVTRFWQLFEESGITKTQFSERSGIDLGNLAKYLKEDREPGIYFLALMAKGVGKKLKDLTDFPED